MELNGLHQLLICADDVYVLLKNKCDKERVQKLC
jgi:hypothetical protein